MHDFPRLDGTTANGCQDSKPARLPLFALRGAHLLAFAPRPPPPPTERGALTNAGPSPPPSAIGGSTVHVAEPPRSSRRSTAPPPWEFPTFRAACSGPVRLPAPGAFLFVVAVGPRGPNRSATDPPQRVTDAAVGRGRPERRSSTALLRWRRPAARRWRRTPSRRRRGRTRCCRRARARTTSNSSNEQAHSLGVPDPAWVVHAHADGPPHLTTKRSCSACSRNMLFLRPRPQPGPRRSTSQRSAWAPTPRRELRMRRISSTSSCRGRCTGSSVPQKTRSSSTSSAWQWRYTKSLVRIMLDHRRRSRVPR